MTGSPGGPFSGHSGAVFDVAFSPDGTRLVSAGADGSVQLWDLDHTKRIATLTGHSGAVLAVAFSPDGSRLASAGVDGTVRLWDAERGEQITAFLGHSSRVHAVAFSPDGTRVASGGLDGTTLVWDLREGAVSATLTGHAGRVWSVAFSPDGAWLASGHADGSVGLWDPVGGEQIASLVGRVGDAFDVAFDPSGPRLAAAGGNGSVQIWEGIPPVDTSTVLPAHGGPAFSVAFSRDGALLASAGADGSIQVRDFEHARTTTLARHIGRTVLAVAFSPDASRLASAGEDGSVRLWDPYTGETMAHLTGHVGGAVLAVAFSPDGKALASAGEDRSVRLWGLPAGEQLTVLTGHTGAVLTVASSPDGTRLASAGDDGSVRLWDRQKDRGTTIHTDRGQIWSVAFSPDGTRLAAAGVDEWRLWDVRGGQQVEQIGGERGTTLAAAFSPDGTFVATAGGDNGAVQLWWAESGAAGPVLSGHDGLVWSLAYSADGTRLASAGADGTVRLWNTRTHTQAAILSGHTGEVLSVAFDPYGRRLASAGADGAVRLWDAHTGESAGTLVGHTGPVRSVAFSPDGRHVASAGDSTIRLWDPVTGRQTAGTGFGLLQPKVSLAGVHTDSPSETDEVGVKADVETLATLVSSLDTEPPLAIAVLGEWGAGKSSVLAQMQHRVAELAQLSTNNPGRSAFAATVRQVSFNAWHFSGEQLWAGLVAHLFQTLAADPASPEPEPDSEEVEHQRNRLRADLEKLEGRERSIRARLRTAGAQRPTGRLAWLGSPTEGLNLLWPTVRSVFHDVRSSAAALALWLVVLGCALTLWFFAAPWLSVLVGLAGTVLTPLGPALYILKTAHGRATRVTEHLRGGLERDQRAVAEQLTDLRARLAQVDAAYRLAQLLAERAGSADYRSRRGLLGQVHDDLERLPRELRRARSEWGESRTTAPPPLQRIVVYIDDLDRCPPERVVQVLEAIHLMLALPLFVVVVAVDPRWMLSSLRYHYRELFTGADSDRQPGAADLPTPLDYLDKIFQIPFAVRALGGDTAGHYLASLMATRGHTAPPAVRVDPPAAAVTAGRPSTAPVSAAPTAGSGLPGPAAEHLAAAIGLTPPPGTQDLQPVALRLSTDETTFMGLIGALVRTPRAAKKLVNLYRLVRITVPDEQLPAFTTAHEHDAGAPYQVVQILLAILVGSPTQSRAVFAAIRAADPKGDIRVLLSGPLGAGGPDSTELAAACHQVVEVLDKLPARLAVSTDVASYQKWCSHLARYSFHTRNLVGPPSQQAEEA